MNLAYTFDENFIPQTAVSVLSVCENNREAEEICFYLLTLRVPEEEKCRLSEMIGLYDKPGHRRNACFISLQEIREYFDFAFDTAGWNPIVLARLLLHRLLPSKVHRVLYLDSDTLVRGNLTGLFETDLQGNPIGACIEPTCSHERKERLGLKGCPYYNAGVLLMDLDLWRKEGIADQILTYYNRMGGKLFANDQDAINGCLKGRIFTLSCTYNYHNTYDIYRYRLLEKNCDYGIPSKEEIRRIKKDPHLVHFLGEERPWRAGNTHRFREEYALYLAKTPWKDTKPEEGWQVYFICWRIFNILTWPFPMLRCGIINRLMPRMLKKKHRQDEEKVQKM